MIIEKEQHQQISEMKEIIVLLIIQSNYKKPGNKKRKKF